MHQQARAYAGTAVFLWSTVPSAVKLSLRYVDHLRLLLYANATSVVVLFAILALQGVCASCAATPSPGSWSASASACP